MTKKKITILEPALKEKSGKVDPAPSKAWSHDELEAAKGLKKKKVTEGFEASNGKFVSREKAAKIAKKTGEVKNPGRKLHSTELRVAAGVKKKVLK